MYSKGFYHFCSWTIGSSAVLELSSKEDEFLFLWERLSSRDLRAVDFSSALHERAEAVALSIAVAGRADILEHELSLLRQALGDSVHLFVGGRAARAYQQAVTAAGGKGFESLHAFSEFIVQTAFV